MARLRYNGLRGTLGGSLTNSATSVTFGAALSYNNGAAVPTLSGGDYIPLTILDSSGNLSEVVNLTAYTSGATTGTIARGQEGTSGVSHASGDKWVHGATTTDFLICKIATAVRTSSSINFTSSGWQNVDTGMDLVFSDVKVGDYVTYSPNFYVGSAANALAFDVATIVSGSPVNYFGTAGGASDDGVMAWYCPSNANVPVSGEAFYVVQSGDISSGSLTLRLRVRPTNTTTRTISAVSTDPMRVAARLFRNLSA